MSNAINIIKELLSEEKVRKVKKGLKMFYNIDIFIKEEGQEQNQEEPVQQAEPQQQAPAPVVPAPMPAPMPAPTQPAPQQEDFKGNVLRLLLREEENIDKEKRGEIEVTDVEIENIQTMEDLIDFLTDKKKKNGEPILNEFCAEVVLTLTGSGETQLSDLLKKEDKILIDIDYGSNKEDSVGFKVLKRSGVQNISIMMKKDGSILPNKFDVITFNNQIIAYRNSIVGAS